MVKLGDSKKLFLNLMSYDNDSDFLDSCPKVDLTPCDVESDYFNSLQKTPIIREYAALKNQLILLRVDERKEHSRMQFMGFVEGRDDKNQIEIN